MGCDMVTLTDDMVTLTVGMVTHGATSPMRAVWTRMMIGITWNGSMKAEGVEDSNNQACNCSIRVS